MSTARLPYGNLCHTLGVKETAMGTMNISLPDPMKTWVEGQTRSGRYANSSDYVRDLIRRDRARLEAIGEIQTAVDAGLASGPAEPLDREAFKARMRTQHAGK
jgi:antitoxin ParD1/3/4